MNNPLEELIKTEISESGPMTIGRFMTLALAHPQYGYYMTRDPLGRAGDFVTAPEISQLFGEMIGVWCVQAWQERGAPDKIALVECGPGRGTLMADLLRTARMFPPFFKALEVHLLEISPVLKSLQHNALSRYAPTWHESLETLPEDCPLFVVANEFLDALPFNALQRTPEGWQARVITCGPEGRLVFSLCPAEDSVLAKVPSTLPPAQDGMIYEQAPAREAFVRVLAEKIERQGGAGLLCDYGPARSGYGDTFQAVKNHAYQPVLADAGQADLTSHVDFEALKKRVPQATLQTQGDFLRACGIEARAKRLEESDPSVQNGLVRLIGRDQMGDLFKVLWWKNQRSPA